MLHRKIVKFITLFLILTLSLFSLSGCHSTYNIDNLAYVVALGLDVGENNKIKISFQLSVPGSSSGSSGSSQSDSSVVNSIECSSIDSGINLLNTYLSKEVNLSHCKAIVFSEEFAYNGISESLYTLMNNVQIRPDCNVIITRCNAAYFLDNSKTILEKLSARYYEIAPSSSEYTGFTANITLSEFFSAFNDTFREAQGILGGVNVSGAQDNDNSKSANEKDSNIKANETLISSKDNIENLGLAVFHGDKLVGELSGIETVCHRMVSNKLNTCMISIPSPFDEGETISLKLNLSKKTHNNVELTDNGPYISTKINLEARILTMSENSDYLDANNISLIEKYVNSYLESHMKSYLYKISKELNSDIDGFGQYAVKNFKTWDEWINYHWLDNFHTAFFNISVKTDVKSGYILMES